MFPLMPLIICTAGEFCMLFPHSATTFVLQNGKTACKIPSSAYACGHVIFILPSCAHSIFYPFNIILHISSYFWKIPHKMTKECTVCLVLPIKSFWSKPLLLFEQVRLHKHIKYSETGHEWPLWKDQPWLEKPPSDLWNFLPTIVHCIPCIR